MLPAHTGRGCGARDVDIVHRRLQRGFPGVGEIHVMAVW